MMLKAPDVDTLVDTCGINGLARMPKLCDLTPFGVQCLFSLVRPGEPYEPCATTPAQVLVAADHMTAGGLKPGTWEQTGQPYRLAILGMAEKLRSLTRQRGMIHAKDNRSHRTHP